MKEIYLYGRSYTVLYFNGGTYTAVYATEMVNIKINQQNIDLGIVESILLLKKLEKGFVSCIAAWNVEWTGTRTAIATGSITNVGLT